MEKMKSYSLLFVIFAILFFGCTKNIESVSDLSDEMPTTRTVNMNSDSLNIVYGFGSDSTEILFFDGDNALRTWADTIVYGYFFTEILDSISVALAIAEERNEFDTLDITGKVSDEYQEVLEGMVHSSTGGRGLTQLFEHINYGGNSKMIWYPTPYVGKSWNNETSSIQYAAFGCVLCDYRWWGGRKVWLFTLYFGYQPELGSFNDKTTSVFIW